jgi:hypothetical protein
MEINTLVYLFLITTKVITMPTIADSVINTGTAMMVDPLDLSEEEEVLNIKHEQTMVTFIIYAKRIFFPLFLNSLITIFFSNVLMKFYFFRLRWHNYGQ